jgi:CheY-like chemotaxis protein
VQPTAPVITASGNDKRGLRAQAFRVGAHAFLAKPFRAAPRGLPAFSPPADAGSSSFERIYMVRALQTAVTG